MKQIITPWIPTAFCAFISAIALFGSIWSLGSNDVWWRPAFFAFLPMCFFFVGATLSHMHRDICELEQKRV